jgi:hypothetical protein
MGRLQYTNKQCDMTERATRVEGEQAVQEAVALRCCVE